MAKSQLYFSKIDRHQFKFENYLIRFCIQIIFFCLVKIEISGQKSKKILGQFHFLFQKFIFF